MNTQSRWTNATGIAVAAVIFLWAGTAWAGYINWDVNVEVESQQRTDVPVEGPVQFQGSAKDTDSTPEYEDPPTSEWVKMSVHDSSGTPVPGVVEIDVVKTEKVDKQTRRLEFELKWRPKSKLQPGTTYDFDLEELTEAHGNQQYKSPKAGSFTTADSGGTADTGTSSGGQTDTGISEDPDTGGGGHSPDAGTSWSDAGADASSGGGSGGSSKHDGSNRRACSQTNGSFPLGTVGLTLALFAGAGLARRRSRLRVTSTPDR